MIEFNVKTGILLLIVLVKLVSGSPFDYKRLSEDDVEFDGKSDKLQVQKFLSRLRRFLENGAENTEGAIESRFGGGGHRGHQEGRIGHRDYPPTYGHAHDWDHRGSPGDRPYWGNDYGNDHEHFCNHNYYAHSREFQHCPHHHRPGEFHHQKHCNNKKYPHRGVKPDVFTEETKKPQETTIYPQIDIRLGSK